MKELIQSVGLRLKFSKLFAQDIENILNQSQSFEIQSIESAPLSDRTSGIINSQPSVSGHNEIVVELDQSQDGIVVNTIDKDTLFCDVKNEAVKDIIISKIFGEEAPKPKHVPLKSSSIKSL